jgi:hypothetical protein
MKTANSTLNIPIKGDVLHCRTSKALKIIGVAAGIIAFTCDGALAQGLEAIPGLFATGVDSNGNTLPLGSPDPHYRVLEAGGSPAFSVANPWFSWVDRVSSSSAWIWQDPNGQPSVVTRTFETAFDLSDFDPSSVNIIGSWSVDDVGIDIILNGNPTGTTTTGGFNTLSSFSLSSGFTSGVNTLAFVARDDFLLGGLLVRDISGTGRRLVIPPPDTDSVPGPLPLLGVGAAFGFSRKLRKRIRGSLPVARAIN